MKKFLPSIFTLAAFLFFSCTKVNVEYSENNIKQLLDSLQFHYAPDARVAIFSVSSIKTDDGFLLKGETNLKEAREAIIYSLSSKNVTFTDSISVLPEAQLHPGIFGLITISVGNVRAAPKHSSELTTQLLLGTPVKILKEIGYWYLVQSPDKYIGWIDKPALSIKNEEEMEKWLQSNKIIFKEIYGFAYEIISNEERKVSDLVSGNILKLIEDKADYFKVEFPDERIAFVEKKSAEQLEAWLQNLQLHENSLTTYAKELLGIPYLWGGTSVKGFDCSGFTKTVYFMNGHLLSRDASQQVSEGTLVDSVGDFNQLIPGDLLFFGRRDPDTDKEKVVHVGMWLGNNEYIHASGKVLINSMNANAENFDSFNFSRYLRTKRILNQQPGKLEYLNKKTMW